MSRVLVVDDDGAIRTVVAQALRRAGHDVQTAETLSQADRALAQRLPDVLITDVVLPDGDGIVHVTEVNARHPDLPIIILSAQNTLTTAVRANEVGAYEYLPKPFDLDDLAEDGLAFGVIGGVDLQHPAAAADTVGIVVGNDRFGHNHVGVIDIQIELRDQ